MTAAERRSKLIGFLKTIQRPDRSIENVSDSENLIVLGLADSLALLQIITYLEQTYGIEFGDEEIDTDELSSISGILGVIERHQS